MDDAATEADELERVAAWRRRLVDADPDDRLSARAASRLDRLAAGLRAGGDAACWSELRALAGWPGESDLISDYAEAAAGYRARIGITPDIPDPAAHVQALLAIARSLV